MNTRLPVLLVLALATLGCARDTYTPTRPAGSALTVAPADGATAVRLDAAITLDFGAAVDRAAVEGGTHLLSEYDMFSSCPDAATMGDHGTMMSVMDDPGMLEHMATRHATHGTFSWNAAGTACTFRPDSLMRPSTRYMVHMSGAMLESVQQAGVSMMDAPMNSAGDMMLHFFTIPASDHDGHHS